MNKKNEVATAEIVPVLNPVSCVSSKDVLGPIKKIVNAAIADGKKDGDTAGGYRVYGIAKAFETKSNTFGDKVNISCLFKGTIFAVDPIHPEVTIRSGKMFLPSTAEALLQEELENGGEGCEVKFAFAIDVVLDESAQVGYHYNVKVPVAPKQNDEILALAASFG